MTQSKPQPPPRPLTRREFLRTAALAAAGMLAACGTPATAPPATVMPTRVAAATSGASPTATPTGTPAATATSPAATATALPTATTIPPTATAIPPTATATAVPPTATATAIPSTATPTSPAALAQVALAHTPSYDPKVVHDRLRTMFDNLGGLGDVVRPGSRVAIKVNLTGGTAYSLPGVAPVESFVTHPEVVRALGYLLRDAGASELYIVEAIYGWDSYSLWGYEQVAADIGATLIDLNDPAPYAEFVSAPAGGHVYQEFVFNPRLLEIDTFVSVAKMKCHWNCGVTHALKNLVGLVPAAHYHRNPDDAYRTALHGSEQETGTRLPRVILDLNRARPIHLAVVDGVKTVQGGEGPWISSMSAIAAHALVAGKNAVATDAVATAVMGFDPAAASYTAPFIRCDNYLMLAQSIGLGPHRLPDIGVVGNAINDLRTPFAACWG